MVHHTTLFRWVQRYAPLMEKRIRWYQRYTDTSCRVDETLCEGRRPVGVSVSRDR